MGASKKQYPVLLLIGVIIFGLSSFTLGWYAYRWFNVTIVCGPPPSHPCLIVGLPLSLFAFFILIEITAIAFLGFTLYREIRHTNAKIQELENKIKQIQTEGKEN